MRAPPAAAVSIRAPAYKPRSSEVVTVRTEARASDDATHARRRCQSSAGCAGWKGRSAPHVRVWAPNALKVPWVTISCAAARKPVQGRARERALFELLDDEVTKTVADRHGRQRVYTSARVRGRGRFPSMSVMP